MKISGFPTISRKLLSQTPFLSLNVLYFFSNRAAQKFEIFGVISNNLPRKYFILVEKLFLNPFRNSKHSFWLTCFQRIFIHFKNFFCTIVIHRGKEYNPVLRFPCTFSEVQRFHVRLWKQEEKSKIFKGANFSSSST